LNSTKKHLKDTGEIFGIDLLSDQENRPEARQLLYSLTSYMASVDFKSKMGAEINMVYKLFKINIPEF